MQKKIFIFLHFYMDYILQFDKKSLNINAKNLYETQLRFPCGVFLCHM